MNTFEWSLPTKIVFGLGTFSSLASRLKGLGRRAFIVTSPGFQNDGTRSFLLKKLTLDLQNQGVDVACFSEIEPNPRTATIERAATFARHHRPRYIIGLGGGSVMDAAKCIAMLCENEGSAWDYTYKGPGKPMKKFNHALPIVCVPTIAATGSETNSYAVVTHLGNQPHEHIKSTMFGQALLPTLSLIDPELTYSVSAEQTINGAFDMMTHAMETYLSSKEPAPLQDALTEAMVETIVQWLPIVLKNPTDSTGRSQLSWCGSLALSGVLSGRDGAWPIHALEHGLSACTDVAHGKGLALLLPRVMAFDATCIAEKILRFNRKIFGVIANDPLLSCQSGLFQFMKDVGAWTSLDQWEIPATAVTSIASQAVDHALRIDGILKRGSPDAYLDNVKPIDRNSALNILLSNP